MKKITGIKGSFEKTLKATLIFKAAGINTFIKCVAMKQNLDSLESLYKLGKRLGIYVTVSPRVISGHEGKRSEDYSLGTVKMYKKFYKLSSRYESSDSTASIVSREQLLNKSVCGAGLNSLSIDPFGGVHACIIFRQTIGSICEDSLEDIWDKARDLPYLKNLHIRDVTQNCVDCKYLEHCSVCIADLINKKIDDCGETIQRAQAKLEIWTT